MNEIVPLEEFPVNVSVAIRDLTGLQTRATPVRMGDLVRLTVKDFKDRKQFGNASLAKIEHWLIARGYYFSMTPEFANAPVAEAAAESVEFDRHDAAQAILTPAMLGPDAIFTDPRLNQPFPAKRLSRRIENAMTSDLREYDSYLGDGRPRGEIRTLADLKIGHVAAWPEAKMRRTPNLGNQAVDQIQEFLASQGLRLGMQVTRLDKDKKTVSMQQKPLDYPFETHDEAEVIGNQMLPPGAIFTLPDATHAERFAKYAASIFAKDTGTHKQGDAMKPDFSFGVKRLAPQALEDMQEPDTSKRDYRVYLSDAALASLSKSYNRPQLQYAMAQLDKLQQRPQR